ncbi:MAG TPA: sigma-70 family RNA polymerase sigma factor [Candidatus Acidoferrum sp.]|nr:sigma-70 family RNA polymerase sigma factor [Candidatus Acidoferrum sp.]
MPKETTKQSAEFRPGLLRLLDGSASLVEKLYAQSQAARWGLSLERFVLSLERSVAKRFAAESPPRQKVEDYLGSLHLEDLALACACAAGYECAWEHFFATHKQYLYSAAAAITRRPASDPYAREFADSLYATLYGRETTIGRVSLFNHFHGRSKLSTWLRAVLAQRYIDVLRQEKRLESLEDDEGTEKALPPKLRSNWQPADPNRSRYLRLLADALKQAISSLNQLDRTRLVSYYLKDLTLAEIGKSMNEHEATVSRKLERVRQELKERVIAILKSGCAAKNGPHAYPGHDGQAGLDDAQIRLCFEYAIEAWPFDFSQLLEAIPPRSGVAKSLPQDG